MIPKKILVPIDFSPASKRAARQALEFARRFEAELTLLYVVEPPSVMTPDVILVPPVEDLTYDEFAQQRAQEELRQYGRSLPGQEGVKISVTTPLGHARNAICEQSADHDLIVMGTHGRTGLGRLLLGSVADYVVRHAACPVMTVREPG